MSLEYEPSQPPAMAMTPSFSAPSMPMSSSSSSSSMVMSEQRVWRKTPRKEAPQRMLDDDAMSSDYSSSSSSSCAATSIDVNKKAAEIEKQRAKPAGSFFSTSPASFLKENKRMRLSLPSAAEDMLAHELAH